VTLPLVRSIKWITSRCYLVTIIHSVAIGIRLEWISSMYGDFIKSCQTVIVKRTGCVC